MDTRVRVVVSTDCDIYSNQALELLLFDEVEPGQNVLYLWQNSDTVVIGRNQNAYEECNIANLEKAGGKLARRLSGGGAVFHNLDNLNFTFISNSENFSLNRNRKIVLNTFSKLGLNATLSGRNDIEISGAKVSGNAYFSRNGINLHHGTILVDADFDKFKAFLTPSVSKLSSKNIKSVESRVTSLSAIKGKRIEVDTVKNAIISSFQDEYGVNCQIEYINPTEIDNAEKRTKFFKNNIWIYGKNRKANIFADCMVKGRKITAQGYAENKKVLWVNIFTDSLNSQFSNIAEKALIGQTIACNEDNCLADSFDIMFKKIITEISEKVEV